MLKPILFNTDMVRALLAGNKTVTRRVVKPHHVALLESPFRKKHPEIPDGQLIEKLCLPPYSAGDILYVRETWQYGGPLDGNDQVIEPMRYYYAADGDPFTCWLNDDGTYHEGMKWRPSIHMPKEAARIFLRVTDVRVERLQEIDADGVLAEGMTTGAAFCGDMEIAAQEFALLWDSTIKPTERELYGWAANPWVWVIEFERCERPKEETV